MRRIPAITRWVFIGFLGLYGLSGMSFAASKTSQARALFLEAREAEEKGEHVRALSLFARAYKLDNRSRDLCFLYLDRLKAVTTPDSAFALGKQCMSLKGKPALPEYKTLGELALRADENEAALGYYRDAHKIKEDDLDVVYVLAGLYEDRQDWKSYASMVRVLLPRLNYPPPLMERQLRAYAGLNQPEEALLLLQEAWQATKRVPYGLSLASYYDGRGLNRSLLRVARSIHETEPSNGTLWLLARAYAAAERPDSAIRVAAALLKALPDQKPRNTSNGIEESGEEIPRDAVLYFYASLLFERGRYAEAYSSARKLSPENPLPAGLFLQGSAALELRKSDARPLLEKALARAPWSPDYRARLAYADYAFKDPAKGSARLVYAASDSLKPAQAVLLEGIAHGQLARTLEPREPHERASVFSDTAAARFHRLQSVSRFEQVLLLDSSNTGALFELASHYERLGQGERAGDLFRRLIRSDSTNAMALNYLGYMLVERLPVTAAELAEAGALLRKAVALDPENGAYLDSKGWWHYRAGALDSARIDLQSALESIPSDPAIKDHLAEVLQAQGRTQEACALYAELQRQDRRRSLPAACSEAP